MFAALELVTSAAKGPVAQAAVAAVPEAFSLHPAKFCPTNGVAPFVASASPVVTSESDEVLAATMDADPPADVTEPITSPATPSPVAAVADWLDVPRLLPSCRLAAEEFVTSAVRTGPAKHEAAPPAVDEAVQKLAFCPTKDATPLSAVASPVSTLTLVDELFASIDVAPADTAPMTCPATPSPVVAFDV